MDGLSERQLLWRVTFPLLRPAFVVVLILPGYRTRSEPGTRLHDDPRWARRGRWFLPWYIYTTGFVNQDLGAAAAMAVVMVIMVCRFSANSSFGNCATGKDEDSAQAVQQQGG